MPLKIAFIGYDTRWTREYLRQLAKDNAEQVSTLDDDRGRLYLKDGGIIEAVPSDIGRRDGVRYDQVIIAEGQRMETRRKRVEDLEYLHHVTMMSAVPEDYRFLCYNTDAMPPQNKADQKEATGLKVGPWRFFKTERGAGFIYEPETPDKEAK